MRKLRVILLFVWMVMLGRTRDGAAFAARVFAVVALVILLVFFLVCVLHPAKPSRYNFGLQKFCINLTRHLTQKDDGIPHPHQGKNNETRNDWSR